MPYQRLRIIVSNHGIYSFWWSDWTCRKSRLYCELFTVCTLIQYWHLSLSPSPLLCLSHLHSWGTGCVKRCWWRGTAAETRPRSFIRNGWSTRPSWPSWPRIRNGWIKLKRWVLFFPIPWRHRFGSAFYLAWKFKGSLGCSVSFLLFGFLEQEKMPLWNIE